MRQIEFRGLRTDGKGWAYGNLWISNGRATIDNDDDDYPVNPSTVGQFIGLHDRNGVKIWEGDTVTVWGQDYFISFNMGGFVAECVTGKHMTMFTWEFNGTDITVTGNIHEPATGRK